jgi:hypothetical protein
MSKKRDDSWMWGLGIAAAAAFVTWQVQKYMNDKSELAERKATEKALEKLRTEHQLTPEEMGN